jgi:hypothetical protein
MDDGAWALHYRGAVCHQQKRKTDVLSRGIFVLQLHEQAARFA